MGRKSGLMIAVLSLVGCGPTSSFQPIGEPPRPLSPKPAASVEVVQAPAKPRGVLVGELEAASGLHVSSEPDSDQTLRELRELAGQHGCDSIIALPAEAHLAATSSGTPLYETEQRARCYVLP